MVASRYVWVESLMDWQVPRAITRNLGVSATYVSTLDGQPKELWPCLVTPGLLLGADSCTPATCLLVVGAACSLDNCTWLG